MKSIAKFLKSDDGVTAIEYALVGSLIAMAIVVVVAALGGQVKTLYQSVARSFPPSP
ncbi:MAG: Flp/Fap pilin component [Deltaproteobacteria bacterium]|nr:Flp/Fap pilin component [Deltaproteobacteria bacterium]